MTKPTACKKCGKRHVRKTADGGLRCQGHNKAGKQCGKGAIKDREYCRNHGGTQAVGAANGNFSHGRYSKLLPLNLAEHYQRSRTDPDLLSMREDMALADARLAELAEQLGSVLPPPTVERVEELRGQAVESARDGDMDNVVAVLDTMAEALRHAQGSEVIWAEVRRTQEVRRRLGETERKRLEALREYVTRDRLLTLMAAIIEVLGRHVRDPRVLGAIRGEIEAMALGQGTDRVRGGHP